MADGAPGKAVYDPRRFYAVQTDAEARGIILTREGRQTTAERWKLETPYLVRLLREKLQLADGQTVLDYGCGIGRLAKPLLDQLGDLYVIGADISPNMRALATPYLGGNVIDRFMPVAPRALARLAIKADAGYSVWTLQHAHPLIPNIELIRDTLRPGAPFVLVNDIGRAVPIQGGLWGKDGLDVRALVAANGFAEVEAGALDPAAVEAQVSASSYWALFRRV